MGFYDLRSSLFGTSFFKGFATLGRVGSGLHLSVGAYCRQWFCCGFRWHMVVFRLLGFRLFVALHFPTSLVKWVSLSLLVLLVLLEFRFRFCGRWLCQIMAMLFPSFGFCILWFCLCCESVILGWSLHILNLFVVRQVYVLAIF